jgi:hypothetical protein
MLFLIFACAAAVFPVAAQNEGEGLPKIAVYNSGRRDGGVAVGEKRAFTTFLTEALIRNGRYQLVERNERLLAQIDAEQAKQRSGAVDDAQISQLGKQSGVQYVCVISFAGVGKTYQISARILDVETAKAIAMGVVEDRLVDMNEIKEAANETVVRMLGSDAAGAAGAGDSEVLVLGPAGNFSSGNLTILIDGQRVGSMRGDGTLKVMVQSGTRYLSVKWQGDGTSNELKKPLKFSAKKGQKSMFRIQMKVDSSIKVVPAKG